MTIDDWMFLFYLVTLIASNYILKNRCGVGFFSELPEQKSKFLQFLRLTYQFWLVLFSGAITIASKIVVLLLV